MLLFGSHQIKIYRDRRLLFFFILLVLKHLKFLTIFVNTIFGSESHSSMILLIYIFNGSNMLGCMDGLLLSR